MALSRTKRILLAVALVVLTPVLGAGGYFYWWSSNAAGDWSHVDTIADDAPYQDPALLERAWALPVASAFRPRFVSQPNGSFCGPTSVVDVMRSLGQQADTDTVLEGTGITTIGGMLPGGITLDQLRDLVRTRLPDREVELHRDFDLATFRRLLAEHANDPADRIVVNFHRGPLFARGGGHHSPLGGYLPEEDLVFVLDVNDDYDPWLVPTERLFAAMDTVDSSSGQERGLLVIE